MPAAGAGAAAAVPPAGTGAAAAGAAGLPPEALAAATAAVNWAMAHGGAMPKLNRCGECRTCMQKETAKRGCLRNQVTGRAWGRAA